MVRGIERYQSLWGAVVALADLAPRSESRTRHVTNYCRMQSGAPVVAAVAALWHDDLEPPAEAGRALLHHRVGPDLLLDQPVRVGSASGCKTNSSLVCPINAVARA